MKTLALLLLGVIVTHAKDERSLEFECRVYSEPLFSGEYRDFNEAVPYLDAYDFDNTIASVRATGVWLFYDQPEYNTYDVSYVHYTWGLDYHDTLSDGIRNRVSSLRYAGSQLEMNEDGYNLYHGTYFTGKALYETIDIPDLSDYHQDVNSIIITGTGSWTFCEGAYYTGRCVCLSSNQHDENYNERLDVGFYPSDASVGLYGVSSVRHGCH